MSNTEVSRAAIRVAYGKRRDVNGGLSMAEVKLLAAAGFYSHDNDVPLPYPEGSPVWFEHALSGLESALTASMALQDAIRAAIAATERDKAAAGPEAGR